MLLEMYYKLRHPGTPVPSAYKRSIFTEVWHLVRKFICQNIAPHCITNFMRVNLYRLCGFKIGKGVFIGMKCYLDDLCYDMIEIGNKVTLSYGCYFACHGHKQGHNHIIIKDGAYLGMRCNIIAPDDIEIGEKAIVGAGALVNRSVPDNAYAVGVPIRILDKKVE